ncbi:MAG TPA: HlyD family efflux transporter periplasmic adaptor subunit [Casimicrobiaceae bacterium]|nr:HlyD family efflux transporter periplasmic adaptor subunit [Casimicrobiaceae bacterium]
MATLDAKMKKRLTTTVIVVLAAGAAFYGWRLLRPHGLPEGFASSNGRIEATEIDVAAKIAGRIREIAVKEGDMVTAGQVVARMDTDVLQAQRREAEAQLKEAEVAIETAKLVVAQREAEKLAAQSVVEQRAAELDAAEKRFVRTEPLEKEQAVTPQQVDDDRARVQAGKAAVSAARAQVAAAEANIGTARSQVARAMASVEGARANIQRIQADIDDSELKSPKSGRVQYKIAEPGEVVPAGGRVLNLVDLNEVYMTFYLPTATAGRIPQGADVHLVLDAFPQYVLPAKATFVADVAQFTPKTVQTEEERLKLTFRIKAYIDPALLQKYITQVKTGLPGVAYVRLDPTAAWPAQLEVRT